MAPKHRGFTLLELLVVVLIIGITLAVLARLEQMRLARYVFSGVGAALFCSILFAFGAGGVRDLFEGAGQEVLNGAVLMTAAAMITYVVVWLKESRKHIFDQMSAEVQRRSAGTGMGIFALAFLCELTNLVHLMLLANGSGDDAVTDGDTALYDPNQRDDTQIVVEPGVDNKSL